MANAATSRPMWPTAWKACWSNHAEAVLPIATRPEAAGMTFAGDVAGKRILDVGRGCGPLFAALRDRGAIVTGFDTSTGMLEQARRRLGDGADLQVATPVSGPAAHSSRDHLAGKEPAVIGPALIVRTSSPEEPHRQKNLIARRTSSPEE